MTPSGLRNSRHRTYRGSSYSAIMDLALKTDVWYVFFSSISTYNGPPTGPSGNPSYSLLGPSDCQGDSQALQREDPMQQTPHVLCLHGTSRICRPLLMRCIAGTSTVQNPYKAIGSFDEQGLWYGAVTGILVCWASTSNFGIGKRRLIAMHSNRSCLRMTVRVGPVERFIWTSSKPRSPNVPSRHESTLGHLLEAILRAAPVGILRHSHKQRKRLQELDLTTTPNPSWYPP